MEGRRGRRGREGGRKRERKRETRQVFCHPREGDNHNSKRLFPSELERHIQGVHLVSLATAQGLRSHLCEYQHGLEPLPLTGVKGPEGRDAPPWVLSKQTVGAADSTPLIGTHRAPVQPA